MTYKIVRFYRDNEDLNRKEYGPWFDGYEEE